MTRASITINPGGVGDPVRDECFRGMQVACAGATIGSALAAHVDSLACVIVVAVTDRANAETILESVGRDLRKAVDENWDLVRQQLATSIGKAGHG